MKLVDYKGKYTIAIDEDRIDELDDVVGDITKEELIAEAKERLDACTYYGIPAYIGGDEELNKIFKII